ncbi:molybdate transport system substrate-binding protein [Paraburkholderia sp. WC7.3g]|uniref:substrate-binding domain-containing protein n=1 Tax=Paraburkholderia sp. WC7.3g TaxID=2991070 RepID=UPI003D24055C
MSDDLKGISSMATRPLLARLVAQYEYETGRHVKFESVGGVAAAKRVVDGEAFDIVLLASDAMERLAQEGRIDKGSLVDVVRSSIGIAVKTGVSPPDIGSESALRDSVLKVRAVGYSTGPSGTHVLKVLERWGISADVSASEDEPRLVQASPGVPVGSLIASGEVDIGFQQLSELSGLEGVTLIGSLPDEIQFVTTFSAALCTASRKRAAVEAFLEFITSPAAAQAKTDSGMDAA